MKIRNENEVIGLKAAIDRIKNNRSKEISPRKIEVSENLPFKAIGDKKSRDRIKKIAERLAQSETGLAVMKKAFNAGYAIEIVSGIDDVLGYCDPESKIVTLNASCSDHENVATMAHELRHAGQFVSPNVGKIDKDTTKTQILETRIMEADAEATAALATWELKQKGDTAPWDTFVSDGPTIADAFVKAVEKHGLETLAAKNQVLTSAFKGWYKNVRIRNSYDGGLVDTYNQILGEGGVLQFSDNKSASRIIKSICKGENNICYFSDDHKVLETKEFLSVNETTMRRFKNFMVKRKEKQGLEPDTSLDEIPVRKSMERGKTKLSKIRKAPVQLMFSKDFIGNRNKRAG